MAWNLTGSHVETCSRELMCPRNLSFDHGATYDFCRVTLVFNIREGQVEGTDISGRRVGEVVGVEMAEAKHTRINAFGISYEGKTGLSTSGFSRAA